MMFLFFSSHSENSSAHVRFRSPFSCSDFLYAVEFVLESVDPEKIKQFRHPFTEKNLVKQTELILSLPAVQSGEYHIKVKIYDSFLSLHADNKLLGVSSTTHLIFFPEIASPNEHSYLIRHSDSVELEIRSSRIW